MQFRKQVGQAREALSQDLEALIRKHRADVKRYGLVRATELLVLLEAGERTWKDVSRNPSRRVGTPCDSAERASNDVADSNCVNAYIFVDAVDEDQLPEAAAERGSAARWLIQDGQVILGTLALHPTDRARRRVSDPALRLLDLREDPEGPTLAALHEAGSHRGSPEWQALSKLRDYEDLAGFIVRSRRRGTTTRLNDARARTAARQGSQRRDHARPRQAAVRQAASSSDGCARAVRRAVRARLERSGAARRGGLARVRAWLGGGADSTPAGRGRVSPA